MTTSDQVDLLTRVTQQCFERFKPALMAEMKTFVESRMDVYVRDALSDVMATQALRQLKDAMVAELHDKLAHALAELCR